MSGVDEAESMVGISSSASDSRPSRWPDPQSLRPFFAPAGVAVIGASADPGKLGHGVLRNLISHGYQGAIYPVNPRHDTILGLPCYPDVTSVPDPVELAVIVLPAALCPQALTACGQRGLKAVVVISGGFKETGPQGAAREQELVRIAQRYGLRLMGPNCVGTLDAYSGLNTTFIRTMPRPGYIAFISQSGAICGGLLEWTAGKGIGFSRFATLGNKADVTESDLLEFLADDPHTRVLVAYIEAISDGRRFIDVASRVTPRKPLLVIKAGRTAAGSRAVASHTGSLAGEMAAYEAAFRQGGILQVDTVEDLFNDALALAYGPLPRGPRVAVLTNAGGPATLAADVLERNGLSMPTPTQAIRAYLAKHNHPDAQLGNPIDMLGGAEPRHYEIALQALLAADQFDAVLVILVPQAVVDPLAVAEAIGRVAGEPGERVKPIVACFMGDRVVREPMNVLHRHEIACYQFPEQAARALGALWRYANGEGRIAKRRPIDQPTSQPTIHPAVMQEVADLLAQAAAAGRTHLGEWEVRPILAAYGIPQPQAALACSAQEAARLAAEIGFPVALKIVSPDIVHKSEVGGVMLDLDSQAAVRRAGQEMLRRVEERRPGVRVEGLLVVQMAAPGHELIVGMRRNPQFGPLIMFGLGGVYVELLQDVAFRVAPLARREVLTMIRETRGGKLLQGLRGQPAGDIEAVADVVERVARLALDQPRIQEIDINPLVAYAAGHGALATDVRLILRQ